MIRLLDAQKDIELHREAWSWREGSPAWFRESLDIFKETFEEYIENIPNELHYGIFDGELIAIVRLIETEPYIMNIHLSAKRNTDLNVLVESGKAIRDHLINSNVKGFFGWLPKMNRSVRSLYFALGFTDSGVRCFKGKIRGRLAEFRQYVFVNQKFVENNVKVS